MATAPANYFLPSMPEGLEGLTELALNLRWAPLRETPNCSAAACSRGVQGISGGIC